MGMPSLRLWADEKACKHLATRLQETQKPGAHPITTSDKTKDSAATAVGQSFSSCESVKEENQLV